MGVDLSKIVHSALIGFFIFGAFLTAFAGMGASHNVNIDANNSFDINNTFETSRLIQEKIDAEGTDQAQTFFPAIKTLFSVWELVKATVKDMTQGMQIFVSKIGGGPQMALLVSILTTLLGLSIAFLIVAALFRVGGFKEK